jgi:DNA-binding MarR family transcriptional regulator
MIKQCFDATHERSLGFAFGELVRVIRRDFLEQAREHELTPELWRLLYCLDRAQGCSQTELAATLDITTVTLGRMVDTLEKRGLVRRDAHPGDRRAIRLFLTKHAAGPIARMHELVAATHRRAMRGLTRAEQDQFWSLLARLRENLVAGGRQVPERRARISHGR